MGKYGMTLSTILPNRSLQNVQKIATMKVVLRVFAVSQHQPLCPIRGLAKLRRNLDSTHAATAAGREVWSQRKMKWTIV